MKPNACFRNIDGSDTYPLDQVVYRSEVDGNLLEVVHDYDALRALHSPDEWKKLFAERKGSVHSPWDSGIWGKKELVLPEIDERNIVSLGEGWTQLFDAAPLAKKLGLKELRVKLCGNSHSGSFKDLGMTVLVSQVNQMIADGQPIRAVACASTGDTSAALSIYCAKAGIPSIVFLPAGKISTAQLVQPISNGSIVVQLDTDFDGCMKIVQQVTADRSIYLANSMNSLRVEGQKTIAPEICQQLDWEVPDVVVIPGGNLGNVSALAKGFDDCLELGLIDRKPRIMVAQAENANPFARAWRNGFATFEPVQAKKTLASAIQIGNPVSYPKAKKAILRYDGAVVDVTEQELADAAHEADRVGLYCCPHTGVALAGMRKLRERGVIREGERVVVISTAHGLKFSEFKTGYHDSRLEGVEPKFANAVFRSKPELGAVMDVLNREMDARTRR